MSYPHRTTLAFAIALVIAASAPKSASAQYAPFRDLEIIGTVITGVGGAAAGIFELTLLGFTFDRLADGHGLETGWAITELLWGLSEMGVSALSIRGSLNDNGEVIHPELIGGGVPILTLGILHVAHAIYSFVEGGPPPDGEERTQPRVAVDVAPDSGGAYLRVSGTF
jgi:hypothetical protein